MKPMIMRVTGSNHSRTATSTSIRDDLDELFRPPKYFRAATSLSISSFMETHILLLFSFRLT